MRHLFKISVAMALIVCIKQALPEPVLLSVELPTAESKRTWHDLGIPTYELIGNTAIAVTEENEIIFLKQKGYKLTEIDHGSSLSRYRICFDINSVKNSTGEVIWENIDFALIKQDEKKIGAITQNNRLIRPINSFPLADRFWENESKVAIPNRSIPDDPVVQEVVNAVNTDSIAGYIERLVSFFTRRSLTDSCAAASQWIYDKFVGWGYPAMFDTCYVANIDTGYDRNVIGTYTGKFVPSREIIIGGHYDSWGTTDPASVAPGADDNATGTAVALEAARVSRGIDFEPTIKFFGFASEETGMFGSTHYANEAAAQNVNIGAVLNSDMLGWGSFGFITGGTHWLRELVSAVATKYVPSLMIGGAVAPLCDALPFYNLGYPAIMTIEYKWLYNNYINSVHDSIIYLDPALYTANIKAQIATMAVLGRMPGPVENVEIADVGDGSRLLLQWTPGQETDISGYVIYYGRESGIYTDSIFVSGRMSYGDTLQNLVTDSTYYVSVWALDNDGYNSCYANEVTATPRYSPSPPDTILAEPLLGGIRLDWQKNTDLDFCGYVLYRMIGTGSYDSLLSLTDTSYVDSPLTGENRYYYRIRCYDTEGNLGLPSDSVYSRPITLDQGVLVVDETNNWTSGSFPRDAQQDSFYEYILLEYQHEQYEYGTSGQKPILADFGPYNAVAWFADDYATMLASGAMSDMREYLEAGGKVWFAGWKPSGNIHNSVTYPADYLAGDISYDYFKIYHAELSGTTDSFKTAIGLMGYPDIMVDTLKYPSSIVWGKTLRYIEELTPNATGDTIYVMDMKNDGSVYEGRACAVRDSGKTVFFGFPLYFMDKDQVKAAAQKVMAEFAVPGGVAAERPREQLAPEAFKLSQNIPNPFDRNTTISYQLPKGGHVTLKVYNINGQLVRTLISGKQSTGAYNISWDKRDNHNKQVGAGVYVYQLNIGNETQSRKMIVIK